MNNSDLNRRPDLNDNLGTIAMSFERFLTLIHNGSAATEPATAHGFLTAVALYPGDMEQLSWLHVLCEGAPTEEISERADQAVTDIHAALQAGNFSPLIAAEAGCPRWCAGFVRAGNLDERAWREFGDAFPEAGKPLLFINLVANPELYAELDISTQPHSEFVRESAPLLGATVRKMAAYLLADADARATLDEADLLEIGCEDALRALSDDELMADLIEHEDRVPRILIDECIRRGEALIPHLRAHVANERLWSGACSSGEWWAILHAVFILGAIPGREAADTLLLVFGKMRSHPDDDLLWDWLGNHWPILFQNKREHAAAGLEAMACDRDGPAVMRYEAWAVLLEAGQAAGPWAFEAVLDRLAQVAADARENEFMLGLVGFLLLDFPRERHRPLLENLARDFERARSWGQPFVLKDVEHAFAKGDDPPPWERHRDYLSFYNPAEIRRRQQRWREEDERSTRAAENEAHDWEPVEEPYIRPAPKIGRNDPCPCGSGKKYKKCCLGAE